MGLPFITLFGDKTKEELEAELKKIDVSIADLTAQRSELVNALEKYDCSTKG